MCVFVLQNKRMLEFIRDLAAGQENKTQCPAGYKWRILLGASFNSKFN